MPHTVPPTACRALGGGALSAEMVGTERRSAEMVGAEKMDAEKGMKGCYIYCTDEETREYFKSLLN